MFEFRMRRVNVTQKLSSKTASSTIDGAAGETTMTIDDSALPLGQGINSTATSTSP